MEEYIGIIIGIIGIIISIITYLVGSRKRYNKTLYCDNSRDYMAMTTGTFSDKMVVHYDGKVVTGNMWCVYRTFVNIEQTDIMCGNEDVSIIAPNGKWVDADIGAMTEDLKEKQVIRVVVGDDPSILHLRFENLRENEGFVLQGLLETTESEMPPLKIYHRIPDLNKVKLVKDTFESHYTTFMYSTIIICTIFMLFDNLFDNETFFDILYDMPEWCIIGASFLSQIIMYFILRVVLYRKIRRVKKIVKNLCQCQE